MATDPPQPRESSTSSPSSAAQPEPVVEKTARAKKKKKPSAKRKPPRERTAHRRRREADEKKLGDAKAEATATAQTPEQKKREERRLAQRPEVNALRRRLFIAAYCSGPPEVRANATASALRAGYGPTEKAARVQGSRLLADADVRARVERYLARIDTSVEKTLREIAKVAFSDLRDVVTWDAAGRLTLSPALTIDDDVSGAVQEISRAEGEFGPKISVRMHPKLEALNLLAKVSGMMREREKEPNDKTFTLLIDNSQKTIVVQSGGVATALEVAGQRPAALVDNGSVAPEPRVVIDVPVNGNGTTNGYHATSNGHPPDDVDDEAEEDDE